MFFILNKELIIYCIFGKNSIQYYCPAYKGYFSRAWFRENYNMHDRHFNKKHGLLLGALIMTALLFPAGCGQRQEEHHLEKLEAAEETEITEEKTETEHSREESAVYIYVCGAVNAPGVYEVSGNSRVFEAIRAAGGMTENASAVSVNMARTVTDGEQIYVPTLEEAETQDARSGAESPGSGTEQDKVNINIASKEQLMTLPGIGESKAESILQYREEHGKFESVEDLMKISGIKEGIFNKIKDDIII